MSSHTFFRAACLLSLLIAAPTLDAWGPQGHRLIGQAAFEMLDSKARPILEEILAAGPTGASSTVARGLDEACNWPDTVREQADWKWSAPLHYVNIPRGVDSYDRQRDCPDGLCVSEAIIRYAGELGREQLPARQRWQALAFLCHFAGDLHQPLHAGFRDDRGANNIDIEYQGGEWNLHQFWDSVLMRERVDNETGMLAQMANKGPSNAPWRLADVADWTSESHRIAASAAYPEGDVIDDVFAYTAWEITQERLGLAAQRLATILNAVLGEGDVLVER